MVEEIDQTESEKKTGIISNDINESGQDQDLLDVKFDEGKPK